MRVSFGKHVEEIDDFDSSSVASRIEDLHEAFADPNVKGILSVVGGFNSNQLLREIDWSLIKANPKVFCGFSDITILNDSILAKTGLVTYSGIHYSVFGMRLYFDYALDYFVKAVMRDEPIEVRPSDEWTDDVWFIDQENRQPIKNEGWLVINEGQAQGNIIGGHLTTFGRLRGTEYMPNLDNSVLFIEDDEESLPHHFDSNLVALIQQPGFSGVKAILIGEYISTLINKASLIRQLGAESTFMFASIGMGVGDVPKAEDGQWYALESPPVANAVEALRVSQKLLSNLPADALGILDNYDPERKALVVGNFLNELPKVAGRQTLAYRKPDWLALDDKTKIDSLWDEFGVKREDPRVVSVTNKVAIIKASQELDRGDGVVWASD